MASVTLVESAKISLDMLISGVIENVVSVNPLYEVMPFMDIEGNALAYNRENALGDVQFLGVGGTITAKAAATFTKVTSSLTTLIGDAEVNGLIQATRSDHTDQKAAQVSSKAKSIGRKYQETMITGDGTADTFTGLIALCDAAQKLTAIGAFDLGDLDALIDLVKDKDGQVDYIMMSARSVRTFYSLLRDLGGASINEVLALPSGRRLPLYRGIPIFTNDFIPVNGGVGTNETTIFAGTFDDGSGMHGISGLTARGEAGVRVQEVGASETKDETITRVKMYCGLALFSSLGLAALTGVTN
jgi:HK97 family phage major capsid protein